VDAKPLRCGSRTTVSPFCNLVQASDFEERSGLPARQPFIGHPAKDLEPEIHIVVVPLLCGDAGGALRGICSNPLPQRVDTYALRFGGSAQAPGPLTVGQGFGGQFTVVVDTSILCY